MSGLPDGEYGFIFGWDEPRILGTVDGRQGIGTFVDPPENKHKSPTMDKNPATVSTTLPDPQPTTFPCALRVVGRDRLKRAGFLATTLHFGELSSLAALMAVIEQRDYAAIRDLAGPGLVAFHCWQCAADYCQDCWRIGPPEFDEDFSGFYGCTRGICPARHEQVVDD
jgi:hypothetical protein